MSNTTYFPLFSSSPRPLPRRPKDQTTRNCHPNTTEARLQDLLCEFKRLAVIGPHLLEDIGFRRNPQTSSPARDIWERDGMRIALETATGQARYLPPPDGP